MARKIKREQETIETTTASSAVPTEPESVSAGVPEGAAAVSVSVPACKQEADGVIVIDKRPALVVIRILQGQLFYNDRVSSKRMKLEPGKPVRIVISQ